MPQVDFVVFYNLIACSILSYIIIFFFFYRNILINLFIGCYTLQFRCYV